MWSWSSMTLTLLIVLVSKHTCPPYDLDPIKFDLDISISTTIPKLKVRGQRIQKSEQTHRHTDTTKTSSFSHTPEVMLAKSEK